jgi:hypothetical protein
MPLPNVPLETPLLQAPGASICRLSTVDSCDLTGPKHYHLLRGSRSLGRAQGAFRGFGPGYGEKMNIEYEGESHDVIDNKGSIFLTHDVVDNKGAYRR